MFSMQYPFASQNVCQCTLCIQTQSDEKTNKNYFDLKYRNMTLCKAKKSMHKHE